MYTFMRVCASVFVRNAWYMQCLVLMTFYTLAYMYIYKDIEEFTYIRLDEKYTSKLKVSYVYIYIYAYTYTQCICMYMYIYI